MLGSESDSAETRDALSPHAALALSTCNDERSRLPLALSTCDDARARAYRDSGSLLPREHDSLLGGALTPAEYLGGLCDLVGEIGRYAVRRATARDAA